MGKEVKKGEIFTVPTGEKYHFWKESEGQKYLILGSPANDY